MLSKNEYRNRLSNMIKIMNNVHIKLKFKNIGELLNDISDRIENQEFLISIVGEFNRGKSTLVNALLGTEILPYGITPTTAHLHIIRYGEKARILIHYKDLTINEIEYSKEELIKYTASIYKQNKKISYIEIYYPSPFLKFGNVIVDTPGVNDIDEQRMEITYGFIPISDAVIFLFDASTPFKITEKQFLVEKILSNNIKRIFFVVNKIDVMNEKEVEEAVSYFKKQLSEILKDTDTRVYSLSAKFGLEGRIKRNEEITFNSRIIEFETQFTKFLLSDERNKVKEMKLTEDLLRIQTLMLTEIKTELLNLDLSQQELAKAKIALHDNKNKHIKLFKNLCEYTEEQRKYVKGKIEVPILKLYREVLEDLLYSIDNSEQDLSSFAEDELPRRINIAIKKWLEQTEQSIEKLIQGVTHQISNGFNTHFNKLSIIEAVFSRINIDDNKLRKGVELNSKEKLSSIEKATFGGGAALGGILILAGAGSAAPIMAVMQILGIGTIVKKYLGGRLVHKEIQNQKKMLKKEIPNLLNQHFQKILTNINKSIDDYFNTLLNSMEKRYGENYSELEEMVRQRLINHSEDEKTITDRKEILKISLNHLNSMNDEIYNA